MYKKYIKLSIFLLGIILGIFFLIKYGSDLYSKIRYYTVSNDNYEMIYYKRRTDIQKVDYKKAIKDNNYVIIDTRELEEYNVGHIPGTKNIRIGDIITDKREIEYIKGLVNSGKIVLLLCHDGDRSIEIASFYKDKYGIDIGIIDNGIENIKRDFRSKGGLNAGHDSTIWSGEFEVLFNYKNQFKILDKNEIKSDFLVNISYDMSNRHSDSVGCKYNDKDSILLKSIYAPIRNMPTIEINNLLAKISSGSVATICYSKSTCFFSKVFGYRVTKQGGIFDGIYVLEGSDCIDKQRDPQNRFRL